MTVYTNLSPVILQQPLIKPYFCFFRIKEKSPTLKVSPTKCSGLHTQSLENPSRYFGDTVRFEIQSAIVSKTCGAIVSGIVLYSPGRPDALVWKR